VALVDGDVLDTDEVLTSRNVLLNGPLEIQSQYMARR
jgi:hypothetical protein